MLRRETLAQLLIGKFDGGLRVFIGFVLWRHSESIFSLIV